MLMGIDIGWLQIIGATIFTIVLGSVWYGPLFGKLWMKIIGTPHMDKKEMKKAQKKAWPYYVLQFAVAFVTNFVLYIAIQGGEAMWGFVVFMLWIGFVLPIQAGEVIWSTLSTKMRLQKLAIGGSFELLAMLAAVYIYINF